MGGTISNDRPSRCKPVEGLAEVGPLASLQSEGSEGYPGFLAQLEEREAEIEIERDVLRAHLVKGNLCIVLVGQCAQSPCQLVMLFGKSPRDLPSLPSIDS